MHTHVCRNGARIHYNPDLSGEAFITFPVAPDLTAGLHDAREAYVALSVPWSDILALVRECEEAGDVHGGTAAR